MKRKNKVDKAKGGEAAQKVLDEPADAAGPAVKSETDEQPPVEKTIEETVDPIEQLRNRVEELEDKLVRSKADLKNFQRRSTIERSEAIRYANAEIMRSLIGVIDDFERSLAAGEEVKDVKSVVEGVRLIYENFMKAMRAHGLVTIEAKHQPFDPNVHEAMMQRPSADHPAGTVLEEAAKGYRLHDRVLRPTKVIVSKTVEIDD